MADVQEALPYAAPPEAPKKPRKPRAPKKASVFSKPITRAQGVAWGGLGLTLGNVIVLALGKWLGVH